MIVVRTCCGCFSLKTGTFIIGSLSLVSTFVNLIWVGIHIAEIQSRKVNDPIAYSIVGLIKIVCTSAMIFWIIDGILAAFLISGAKQRKHSHIRPWLALGFSGIVTMVCISLGTLIILALDSSAAAFFIFLLIVSAIISIQVYFWTIVYSYYKELEAESYGVQTPPDDNKVMGESISKPYYNV